MKLKDFVLALPDEIYKAQYNPKHAKKGNIGKYVITAWSLGDAIFPYSPGGIHPTKVYKVMYDTFGPMNTKDNKPEVDLDDKVTWKWILKVKKGLLSVYDYKDTWSIGYVGPDNSLKDILREDAEILKDAIIGEAKKIQISKKQIKENKLGGIITNPYALFTGTSISLLEEANKIISEIKKYGKDRESYMKEFNRSSIVGALFRTAFITNYLGLEGLINIIYILFLKKRYKNEIFERKIQNEMIITKVLEIDKYCNDFLNPIFSIDDELFRAFQYITNIRNDFLHANIIKDMESHLVQIGEYPLLTEDKTKRKYGISSHPGRITNIDVIMVEKLIQKIVIKIINCLSERIRYKFFIFHERIRIPYKYNDDGLVDFLLREDDYVPPEEIEKILSLSTDLDDEYYRLDEEEYVPPSSNFY